MIGDAEFDFNASGDPQVPGQLPGVTPWVLAVRAIRSVSVPMGLLRQKIAAEQSDALNDISNADSDGTLWQQWQQDVAQLNSWAQQLPALIAAAKLLPEYTNDVKTANELNNWLAFFVDWAGSTLQAVGNLPTDIANYVSKQLQNIADAAGNALNRTSTNLLKGIAPLLIVGLGLLFLLESKSRTYRKAVA